MVGCDLTNQSSPEKITEGELSKARAAVKKVIKIIGKLADWEWVEEFEGPETGRSVYSIVIKPKGDVWFGHIGWESAPAEMREYVEMSTKCLFPGYHWKTYDYPKRVKDRLKKAWQIERKWLKKVNHEFNVNLKDMGPEFSAYYVTFKIDRLNPEEIRKYFMAMKWAYEMAKRELEEKGIVITDKIIDLELKLEDDLEVTEEDIKAALGEV